MTHLKHEWRHDVLAPRHVTLVLKVLVSTVQQPNLFAQRTWYRLLHSLFKKVIFMSLIQVDINDISISKIYYELDQGQYPLFSSENGKYTGGRCH